MDDALNARIPESRLLLFRLWQHRGRGHGRRQGMGTGNCFSPELRQRLWCAARNEITEHMIYRHVAGRMQSGANREVLERIAAQEKGHYEQWRAILGEDVAPSWWKVRLFSLLARFLGLSFSLRLMEKGESLAEQVYGEIGKDIPEALTVMEDEQRHEQELLGLINERVLQYVSSFVLGLNDALVELTGALAGLTLALRETRLIAAVGLITGIAAALSMSAAEYLSTKEEEGKNALQAGAMTGIAYLVTVLLLILPYFFVSNALLALSITLVIALVIIFLFTFYTSIARRLPFGRRFMEMAAISLGVATVNFFIGFAVKQVFGVE
ncbi:MAG: VIT1/CCC1 transporter family protein [Candidatus Peribacteraceae bacterium]|nr:VIT1/CCC1 transporter family protein [Candidatus Peribacteraceae bacterium]